MVPLGGTIICVMPVKRENLNCKKSIKYPKNTMSLFNNWQIHNCTIFHNRKFVLKFLHSYSVMQTQLGKHENKENYTIEIYNIFFRLGRDIRPHDGWSSFQCSFAAEEHCNVSILASCSLGSAFEVYGPTIGPNKLCRIRDHS